MGTDRDWEKWGMDDPYFGVLSDESFRGDALTEDARRKFFQTGDTHIESLFLRIRSRFEPGFSPSRSLDFGCGVGRLLIPMARRSGLVVGVDISPSMLAEARKNCESMSIGNVELKTSDDDLSQLQGSFDLVHSHIVFAHIEPGRGMGLIRRLADKVAPGGFLAVQVLYACNAPRYVRALVRLRYQIPLLNMARNLIRGRPIQEPPMQLHAYPLPEILQALNERSFSESLMVTDRFQDGVFDSVVVIAKRTPAD